jgi:hypothetical protein
VLEEITGFVLSNVELRNVTLTLEDDWVMSFGMIAGAHRIGVAIVLRARMYVTTR